jgi:hypothetical protein
MKLSHINNAMRRVELKTDGLAPNTYLIDCATGRQLRDAVDPENRGISRIDFAPLEFEYPWKATLTWICVTREDADPRVETVEVITGTCTPIPSLEP